MPIPKIDWNTLKKEKEKRQIQLFKECFVQIDKAEIELNENDPPDFCLFICGKKISVEVTELVWDKDKDGRNKKAQESNADYIMYLSRLEYEKLNLSPLQVNVSFVDRYGLLKNKDEVTLNSSDKTNLPKYIVDKVVENFPYQDQTSIHINDFNEKWERVLDEKIESICISRFPELTENCWVADGGGVIPSITQEKITERIEDKNKSLSSYKEMYDSSWLLLIEDWGGISGYFNFKNADDVLRAKYVTEFNRIFILRSKRREVIELNIAEQNSLS